MGNFMRMEINLHWYDNDKKFHQMKAPGHMKSGCLKLNICCHLKKEAS
jgi:hypothetical protein